MLPSSPPAVFTSRLLLLPFSVRELIFKHTFGDSLIHVYYCTTDNAFAAFFCQESDHSCLSQRSATRAPCLALHPGVPDCYQPSHPACQRYLDNRARRNAHPEPETPNPALRDSQSDSSNHGIISALLICRQFYEEIYPILYGTNTFQVETASTFVAFVTLLERLQFQYQKKLFGLELPRISFSLEVVVFDDDAGLYWMLVLCPRLCVWVSRNVSTLSITGSIHIPPADDDQFRRELTMRILHAVNFMLKVFCHAVEVKHFHCSILNEVDGIDTYDRITAGFLIDGIWRGGLERRPQDPPMENQWTMRPPSPNRVGKHTRRQCWNLMAWRYRGFADPISSTSTGKDVLRVLRLVGGDQDEHKDQALSMAIDHDGGMARLVEELVEADRKAGFE